MKTFIPVKPASQITFFLFLVLSLSLCNNKSIAQIINTFPGSATAGFNAQYGVAVDDTGNIFVGDWNNTKLDKITPAGIVSFRTLNGPVGVVFDKSWNMYVTVYNAGMIVRITPQGKMDTLASVASGLSGPEGIAIDPSDTILYATDWNTNRVYSISIATGKVTIIANTAGAFGNAGDNGPATAASFGGSVLPSSDLEEVAVDAFHNIYIADPAANRVRVIAGTSTSNHPVVGYIYPFAGTGVAGSTGDGAAAISALLNYPTGVRVDTFGNVYIADMKNNKIRVVNTAGIISTFAGTGVLGSTGDAHRADSATFNSPYGLAFDKFNNLYVSEQGGNRIRVISSPACVAPVIQSITSASAVCEGSGTSINASVSGSSPISYQWKHSGNNAGLNDSTLTISAVTKTDSGNYTVVATNFCGSATTHAQATLIVNPAPHITITTATDTICSGAVAVLNASGATNYNWGPSVSLNGTTGGSVIASPNVNSTYTVTGTDANTCTSTATKTITVEICTSVTSLNSEEISLYPNPSNGQFSIRAGSEMLNGKLQLFTITGQKIMEAVLENTSEYNVDVKKRGSAIYLLQITTGRGITRSKIIIE